jgi:predicted transcriptional regulator
MEMVWILPEVRVRDLHQRLGSRLAYTTLMTTLDRLYRKSLLNRRKEGRAFVYTARLNKIEFERGVSADLIEELFSRHVDHPDPLLSYLVDAVTDRDCKLLDELDRLVQNKRRELRRK